MSNNAQPLRSSDFAHGTIVALKSHFFDEGLISPVLAGNPLNSSPLMIVVEQLVEVSTTFNERTGENISLQGASQCRCMWFSTKKQEFVDAWFASKLLKVVTPVSNAKPIVEEYSKDTISSLIDQLVIFRTTPIETKKRKSSAINKGGIQENNNIVALLNYVGPVMQIVQVMEYRNIEQKEASYDIKTGNRKRHTHQWVARCKYFNSETEKLIEKIIPLDCLELVSPFPKDQLKIVQYVLDKSSYLTDSKTIVKPYRILYLNGDYILTGYDYVLNKTVNRKIKLNSKFSEIENYYEKRARMFNPESGEIVEISELLKDENTDKKYVRIKYKKDDDEITFRTLTECKKINAPNALGVATDYITGFDHSRKDKRTFLLVRIQSVKILNLDITVEPITNEPTQTQ